MKSFQFIFLRLSGYLIAGILLAFYIEVSLTVIVVFGGLLLCFFLIAIIRAKKLLFPDPLLGIATFILIFYVGFISTFFNMPENQPSHYINKNLQPTDSAFVSGKIIEELKPTVFAEKFVLKTERLIVNNINQPINGKILLNLAKDSLTSQELKPGMKILIPWNPQEFKGPLNPFQFSYKDYMNQLQIERQLNMVIPKVLVIGYDKNLRSRAWKLREKLISNLKRYDFNPDELAVFQALILGQRRDINNELYKNYAAAGAIHILAISGLHIGILLLILNFLFKPIEGWKYGRLLKPLFIILFLWGFSLVTGLSASVVRAVCMFSFLAIGLQLKRKTSSLNSLFLSLFFLLLINPYYLLQVGFQLSYLAVFSIIVFQPSIYGLFTTKIKILNYFWKLTSVSLAAQIGVIPLSIYYFHQFPGLFLITNLVILPFLSLILILGIAIIFLASYKILPGFLEEFYSYLLHLMNSFIEKIAGMDSFVISKIDLSLLQTLTLYFIILSLLFTITKINFQRICLFLIGIISFQIFSLYEKSNIPDHESIIFHQTRNSIIGNKQGEVLVVYSEIENPTGPTSDYQRERKIDSTEIQNIPAILNLNRRLSLIIDTTGNYDLKDFHPQILILRNSPKINLERLLNNYSPQQIVADGSNYKSYIVRWQNTSENKKIPFHYTGEKGAFIIDD